MKYYVEFEWSNEYGSYDDWSEEFEAEGVDNLLAVMKDYLLANHKEVGGYCDGIRFEAFNTKPKYVSIQIKPKCWVKDIANRSEVQVGYGSWRYEDLEWHEGVR